MSAENITKRIKDDTSAECNVIISQAQEKANEIIAAAKAEAARKQAEIAAKSQKDCDEAIRRRLQIAELDIRKQTLAAKRTILGEVMERALRSVCELPQDKWAALITKQVLSFAETGEEKLLVRADEKNRFAALLPALNEALNKSGKAGKLTVADEAAGFAGGFALLGERVELNCSFEVLLREARSNIEREAVGILFPMEV